MVALRDIDDANRADVLALRVAPSQRVFVSDVSASLREAAEHPDAQPLHWAVYDDETPVGFVMIADEVLSPEYVRHYLWKLLIDERFQGRGYGRATLDLVVAYFRARPGVETLTTSAHPGEGSPIAFYERYGFERTGEVSGDEVVLELALVPR